MTCINHQIQSWCAPETIASSKSEVKNERNLQETLGGISDLLLLFFYSWLRLLTHLQKSWRNNNLDCFCLCCFRLCLHLDYFNISGLGRQSCCYICDHAIPGHKKCPVSNHYHMPPGNRETLESPQNLAEHVSFQM